VAAALVQIARRRLGGVTGDVLGATVELATATVLVILVAIPT
jgi:adenosylcobinamide-GDP ribazoletransferase